MSGAGLKIFSAAGLGRVGVGGGVGEVVSIGGAVAAADDIEVEIDVVGLVGGQGAEKVVAELLAGGAGKSSSTPNRTDAVHAGDLVIGQVG